MTPRRRGPVTIPPALAMAIVIALLMSATLGVAGIHAEPAPFLADSVARALAEELSGEAALRNLEAFSRQHRMRGSAALRAGQGA